MTEQETVKVYELAKELGIAPLELVDKLKGLNIQVKNHMSDLQHWRSRTGADFAEEIRRAGEACEDAREEDRRPARRHRKQLPRRPQLPRRNGRGGRDPGSRSEKSARRKPLLRLPPAAEAPAAEERLLRSFAAA